MILSMIKGSESMPTMLVGLNLAVNSTHSSPLLQPTSKHTFHWPCSCGRIVCGSSLCSYLAHWCVGWSVTKMLCVCVCVCVSVYPWVMWHWCLPYLYINYRRHDLSRILHMAWWSICTQERNTSFILSIPGSLISSIADEIAPSVTGTW